MERPNQLHHDILFRIITTAEQVKAREYELYINREYFAHLPSSLLSRKMEVSKEEEKVPEKVVIGTLKWIVQNK